MLLTMSIVVFKVISLIFKCIEGLIFDLPAAAPGTHYRANILPREFNIRYPYPGAFFLLVFFDFPKIQ